MDTESEGNLLEIMDLARTLRQEQLFIQHEQAAFASLAESLTINSSQIAQVSYCRHRIALQTSLTCLIFS